MEKLSGNQQAATEFCSYFQEFTMKENLQLYKIYSVHETVTFKVSANKDFRLQNRIECTWPQMQERMNNSCVV